MHDLLKELTEAAQNRLFEIHLFQANQVIDFFEKNKEVEALLGKKPRAKELAAYLSVTEGAVSQYDKAKKELMILGLWIKKFQEVDKEEK